MKAQIIHKHPLFFGPFILSLLEGGGGADYYVYLVGKCSLGGGEGLK